MSENAIFVLEKNQMNTLDESLIHPSIAVLHLVAPLKQLFRKKNSICVQMRDNLAAILQTPRCEKPVKNWLLCVARENLRLKNSYIYTKIWLS